MRIQKNDLIIVFLSIISPMLRHNYGDNLQRFSFPKFFDFQFNFEKLDNPDLENFMKFC